MDVNGFRIFLKKAGKKEHVIENLIGHVRAFERHLARTGRMKAEDANQQDVAAYVSAIPASKVRKEVRGIALYYSFIGVNALAKFLNEIREKEIAGTRRTLKLREFRGVQPGIADRLEEIGIVTVEHMIAAGKTPSGRRQLAERTAILPEHILELVKLSDLSRLQGVKGVRARLYYDAGLDTPHKFAEWDPEDLRQMLIEFVKRSGFDGIAPLPKELHSTISEAKKLPKAVTY